MRALAVIARKYPGLDDNNSEGQIAADLELQGASYAVDLHAAVILIRILSQKGYLRSKYGTTGLSVDGLLAVEALSSILRDSAQGFVAMSFQLDLVEAYANGFAPAIQDAGFNPMRLDNQDFVGGISDQIVTEIRRSRFVIVDYTHQRPNVYFEAGFALGLGLIVIPTCREDQANDLHFDVRHLNTLTWQTPADLRENLSRRIAAVIGTGPIVR